MPDAFARTDVLVMAVVMFLVEFVVDKIPWLDSVWDGISTIVRPTVGAWVAWQLAGDSSECRPGAAHGPGRRHRTGVARREVGRTTAVNTSPEPFSNAIVSTAEDVGVITIVALAVAHPWWALGITASLLIAGAATVFLLWRTISRARRRRRRRTP